MCGLLPWWIEGVGSDERLPTTPWWIRCEIDQPVVAGGGGGGGSGRQPSGRAILGHAGNRPEVRNPLPLRAVSFGFSVAAPTATSNPLTDLCLPLSVELTPIIGVLPGPADLDGLRAGLKAGDPITQLAVRQIIERLVLVTVGQGEVSGRIRRRSVVPAWLDESLAILRQADPARLPSAAFLANRAGLNRDYFTECFARITGRTFAEFVRQLRIDAAQRLIGERPDLSLQQVAERCGFTEAAHFTREFKRTTGITPSRWREQPTASGSCTPSDGHPVLTDTAAIRDAPVAAIAADSLLSSST